MLQVDLNWVVSLPCARCFYRSTSSSQDQQGPIDARVEPISASFLSSSTTRLLCGVQLSLMSNWKCKGGQEAGWLIEHFIHSDTRTGFCVIASPRNVRKHVKDETSRKHLYSSGYYCDYKPILLSSQWTMLIFCVIAPLHLRRMSSTILFQALWFSWKTPLRC